MQEQVQQSEHSRRGSACDSWNHLDCAKDRQPHCWRPRRRRTMSALVEASPRLTPPCDIKQATVDYATITKATMSIDESGDALKS